VRRLHAAPTAPKADQTGPYSPCSRLGPLEHREGEGLGAHFPHAKRNDEGSWANASPSYLATSVLGQRAECGERDAFIVPKAVKAARAPRPRSYHHTVGASWVSFEGCRRSG